MDNASHLTQQVAALGASDWQTRRNAYTFLQQRGSESLDALIAGMAHSDWRVRKGCADLMDHLADARCVEPLLRLLHDPIADVRRLALHALGCQGCKVCPLPADTVVHLIRLATADPSVRVRRVATHQLGCQPPDARAIAALQELLEQETDAKLRSRATWALQQQRRESGA